MLSKLTRKCQFCRREKLWFLVKERTLVPKVLKFKITSTQQMCGRCFKIIKGYDFKQAESNEN